MGLEHGEPLVHNRLACSEYRTEPGSIRVNVIVTIDEFAGENVGESEPKRTLPHTYWTIEEDSVSIHW